MEGDALYGASSAIVSLGWMAVGLLALAVGFLAFQASRKPGLESLRISAIGFGVLGLAALAGPIVGWLFGMVARQIGADIWFWLALLKGLIGAAIDAIGFAAIGFGLWKLQKS